MSKQGEREYAVRASQADLHVKPFNCPRVFREFATALELFQQRIPSGSILDLGCGPGWTSRFLARAGYDVVGVDIADRMIEIARERSATENVAVEFHVADMEELDLPRRDFDGALFFDCLHHCPNYQEVLRRTYEHLRPGGYVVLFETTWLHRYSPHAKSEAQTYGITEQGFSRRQLRRSLREAGFSGVTQYHDPGPTYRGIAGLLATSARVWCGWLTAFPQTKNIMVAQK